MHESSSLAHRPLFTRRYDPQADRFTVVADVGPASVDDLSVFAGERVLRIEIDDEQGTTTRSVRPPSIDVRFTADRRAVLHNGILEVTVGVSRRGRGLHPSAADRSESGHLP